MKVSIKDFFSKCDQIRNFLRIWSHLLKISLMENFVFMQWSIKKIIANIKHVVSGVHFLLKRHTYINNKYVRPFSEHQALKG